MHVREKAVEAEETLSVTKWFDKESLLNIYICKPSCRIQITLQSASYFEKRVCRSLSYNLGMHNMMCVKVDRIQVYDMTASNSLLLKTYIDIVA